MKEIDVIVPLDFFSRPIALDHVQVNATIVIDLLLDQIDILTI